MGERERRKRKKAEEVGRVKRTEEEQSAVREEDSARGRERKGSQEKGEVADLELPRSSGRLHPASSCARREKSAGTLFTSTACTRTGGFAKSFKFVRNAGPLCSKDAGFDWRQARRLPAASLRNSRNRTLSAMLARSLARSHVKSHPRIFRFREFPTKYFQRI